MNTNSYVNAMIRESNYMESSREGVSPAESIPYSIFSEVPLGACLAKLVAKHGDCRYQY